MRPKRPVRPGSAEDPAFRQPTALEGRRDNKCGDAVGDGCSMLTVYAREVFTAMVLSVPMHEMRPAGIKILRSSLELGERTWGAYPFFWLR